MTHSLNMRGSKEDAAALMISMANINEDEEIKEIYACQDKHSLISINLKNFAKPVKAGSLIYARGSMVEAMGRTKMSIDVETGSNRWVILEANRAESNQDLGGFINSTIADLSDDKGHITEDDLRGLCMKRFMKDVRHYKIISYELTKEDKKSLANETPNYIKGEAYDKLFQIFKVK